MSTQNSTHAAVAALRLYEAAHEDLFLQCCSNPIKNAWGKEVNLTKLNIAHEAAGRALNASPALEAPAAVAPQRPPMPEQWSVVVSVGGENILCIGDSHLSGREPSETEEQAIIGVAQHLLAFVGYSLPPCDFDPHEEPAAPAEPVTPPVIDAKAMKEAFDCATAEGKSFNDALRAAVCATIWRRAKRSDGAPDAVGAALVSIATECALHAEERHSYLPNSPAQAATWRPHDWVLQAMSRAISFDHMMNSAAPAAPAVDAMSQAARDVVAERRRQVDVEGWTPAHDDGYRDGDLALAASSYACAAANFDDAARDFPWPKAWWKPSTPRRNLEKAGALIIAEIERLDRAAAQAAAKGEQPCA